MIPFFRMRQMMVDRRSAQHGNFLYTRYGIPFGPGDDLFGLRFKTSRNFLLEGIRFPKGIFGGTGLFRPGGRS